MPVDDSLAAPAALPARPWWTQRRRSFAWLVLVVLGCVVAFVVVYRVTVHTSTWRIIDDIVLRGADLGSGASDPVEGVLDTVTVTSMVAAVALVAIIALLRMHRVLGVAAVVLLVLSNVLSRVLKAYVLSRPDLGLAEYTPATLNSLPSGHATATFSVVAALLFVVPSKLRPTMATVGVVASSTVAFATMVARWHRAADSVASFLLVTGLAAAIAIVVLAVERPPGAVSGSSRVPAEIGRPGAAKGLVTVPGIVGGALLVVSAVLALILTDDVVRDSWLGEPAAFLSASLMVVGAAMACTIVVMRAVERISLPPKRRARSRTPSADPSLRPSSPGSPSSSQAPPAPAQRPSSATPPTTGPSVPPTSREPSTPQDEPT